MKHRIKTCGVCARDNGAGADASAVVILAGEGEFAPGLADAPDDDGRFDAWVYIFISTVSVRNRNITGGARLTSRDLCCRSRNTRIRCRDFQARP